MKEGKEVVEGIREKSVDRPLRVVVDEVFPDGSVRILLTETKRVRKEPVVTDSADWGEEEERYLSREELGRLLTKKQLEEIREGQVFRIKSKRSKDYHEDARKHMKERTKALLEREGFHDKAKEGK